MSKQYLAENDLYLELEWLLKCISQVVNQPSILDDPPALASKASSYTNFVLKNQLNSHERLMLVLALSNHLSHNALQNLNIEGNPALLHQLPKTGVLLPTGETFLYIASGGKEQEKLELHQYFDTSHLFYKKSIIQLAEVENSVPATYGILSIHENYRELFLYNRFSRPRFSNKFPAHLIETNLSWQDLVLNERTKDNIEEIKAYLNYEQVLRQDQGLSKHLKPGYRMLFHGPSGTGKTLTASLLGKHLDKEVYRVDLSTVISKYVGETAKNLNTLFNVAEDKGWILFFDEGDALFGKRANANAADNKNVQYANQDVAFLLQRIENFNGLVIVATNFKENLDPAFTRRFQSIVPFNLPKADKRLRLWQENLPSGIGISNDIALEKIAKAFTLSAAAIIKVIQRATILTLKDGSENITWPVLEQCINAEVYNTKQSMRR